MTTNQPVWAPMTLPLAIFFAIIGFLMGASLVLYFTQPKPMGPVVCDGSAIQQVRTVQDPQQRQMVTCHLGTATGRPIFVSVVD